MFKLLTVSFIAALASANTIVTSDANAAWPALNTYYTFKAATELYTWDGSKLESLKGITADLKVDSVRNKIKADAKVTVPIFGSINAQVLIDLTAGTALEYVPFLGVC